MSRASDRAYEKIRALILSGELAAGDQIGEEALAQRCGVSRTPVRDALRRLESELLVRRNETQRSFVAEWSLDDIADSFDLRAILEGRAARRAAERMNDASLRELEAANRKLGQAIEMETPDIAGFVDANREFHDVLLAAAASPRLAALLTTLVEQPIVQRTARQYGRDALRQSYNDHQELLAAFARRDGAWAEAVMAAHVRRAFHAYADAQRGTGMLDKRLRKA